MEEGRGRFWAEIGRWVGFEWDVGPAIGLESNPWPQLNQC